MHSVIILYLGLAIYMAIFYWYRKKYGSTKLANSIGYLLVLKVVLLTIIFLIFFYEKIPPDDVEKMLEHKFVEEVKSLEHKN